MDPASTIRAYITTASATLLVYDLVCTFDEEIAYVWMQPWSIGTFLFFLNRYLPFVDMLLSLDLMWSINTPEVCRIKHSVIIWLTLSGVLLSEAILMLRTYALWNCRRSILILFSVMFLAVALPSIIVGNRGEKALIFKPAGPVYIYGCHITYATSSASYPYTMLLIVETIVVALTMIKAAQHLPHTSPGSWVHELYRQGFLFYLYMFSTTVANIVVPLTAAAGLKNSMSAPQRVSHSILCNRVLLLILRQRSSGSLLSTRLHQLHPPNSGPQMFTSVVDETVDEIRMNDSIILDIEQPITERQTN